MKPVMSESVCVEGTKLFRMEWGWRIPTRDGAELSAVAYLPTEVQTPTPAIFTFTPYVAQGSHEAATFFAAAGFAFISVDVRGRGNSHGCFVPNLNDGQ